MEKKNFNKLFLIAFTLFCIFVFNINGKALKVGESTTFAYKCTLNSSGARISVSSEGLPLLKRHLTTVTCTAPGTVEVDCDTGLFSHETHVITCEENPNGSGGTGAIDIDPQEDDEECEKYLGRVDDPTSIAYLLQEVFDVIKFVDVVLVLVLTIVSFTQAVVKGGDELKKAGITTLKRVIIGVVIFFVPGLISFFFNMVGLYGTCGIG